MEKGVATRAGVELKVDRVLAERPRCGAHEPPGKEVAEPIVLHVHLVFSPDSVHPKWVPSFANDLAGLPEFRSASAAS